MIQHNERIKASDNQIRPNLICSTLEKGRISNGLLYHTLLLGKLSALVSTIEILNNVLEKKFPYQQLYDLLSLIRIKHLIRFR